jgi:two-component system sensor histidine kinase FlrB
MPAIWQLECEPGTEMGARVQTPQDERLLLSAFRSFSQVAASLEMSYRSLQDEVERLRNELAKSNSELEEAQAKLRHEESLAEVSALLAHEIRNPLGSLELFAGLLAESDLAAEHHEWVEQMQAGLRTLAATVNNVLNLNNLSPIERVSVDLGELLEWARGFFIPLARQSHITLSLQNRLSGVLFPADRHRLEQVFLNLMLNSVRAMPDGGWIEVAGRKKADGEIVLTVADTGPGIAAKDLPHIFERGFSRRGGSPGLGLTVCRKIIEQHDGTICASNRRKYGTIVTVTLPVTARNEGASR